MKRICTFLVILVALFLVGCARTPGTEVFRFEVRSYELTIGEKVQLDLIMGSHVDEEVVFEILDESSAIKIVETKNDSVIIEALEVGAAEFKAYLKNTVNVNDVIVVTVSNPKVDYIDLTAEKNEMYVGENLQVVAKGSSLIEGFTPKFVYATSNKKIATVDENGLVTAVGGGKVEITAYEENDPSLYKTFAINVKYVEAAELVIEETEIDLFVGDTYKIKGVAYDANGLSNTVSQTFKYVNTQTKKISVNDEGVVKGIDAGTVTITVNAGSVKEKITFNIVYKNEIEGDELVLINGFNTATSFSEYFGVKNLSAKVVSGDASIIELSSKDAKVKGVKTGSVKVNLTNGTVSKDVTIKVINVSYGGSDVFKNNISKLSMPWSSVEANDNKVECALSINDGETELDFELFSSNEDVFKVEKTEDGFKLDVINTGISTLKIVCGNFVKEFVITIENK